MRKHCKHCLLDSKHCRNGKSSLSTKLEVRSLNANSESLLILAQKVPKAQKAVKQSVVSKLGNFQLKAPQTRWDSRGQSAPSIVRRESVSFEAIPNEPLNETSNDHTIECSKFEQLKSVDFSAQIFPDDCSP